MANCLQQWVWLWEQRAAGNINKEADSGENSKNISPPGDARLPPLPLLLHCVLPPWPSYPMHYSLRFPTWVNVSGDGVHEKKTGGDLAIILHHESRERICTHIVLLHIAVPPLPQKSYPLLWQVRKADFSQPRNVLEDFSTGSSSVKEFQELVEVLEGWETSPQLFSLALYYLNWWKCCSQILCPIRPVPNPAACGSLNTGGKMKEPIHAADRYIPWWPHAGWATLHMVQQ